MQTLRTFFNLAVMGTFNIMRRVSSGSNWVIDEQQDDNDTPRLRLRGVVSSCRIDFGATTIVGVFIDAILFDP